MKIISFVDDAKEKVIRALSELAGSDCCTRKRVSFSAGSADSVVITGGGIEKASVTHLILKNVKPPESSCYVDYMVFQMEIFPENPYCPMGHFNTEWALTGNGPYHMNLDLFPAANCDRELETVGKTMDRVAERYGFDPIKMREGLSSHYALDHWDKPLSSCVGCKLMHLDETQIDLFIEAYHTFFTAYLTLLKDTMQRPFTEQENLLKLRRNGKWLEYLTLKDAAVKMGLSVGIPPEVIIRLSYPPSAVF